MSLTSMHENGKGNDASSVSPMVIAYAPKQMRFLHELGTTTVQMIDQIAEIEAAEIEKVAEEVERKAHETAEGLRAYARQMRAAGVLANERLANFVRFAATCNDAAKMVQQSVQHDAPRLEPLPAEITPPHAPPIDLDGPALQ